ncbi:MAG: sugar ABC transporter permease [Candidatus Sumerlaeota bacterium]|nr:sugar ABC transporter permease [Candidatus Sumerlaeota bacterium]
MALRTYKLAPYLFVSPFFLLFAVFSAYPILLSIHMSLYDSIGFNAKFYVGWENYSDLLKDPLFWKSILNTVYYAAGIFLIEIPLALGIALLLNNKLLKGRSFFRLAFFSPVLIAGVFIAIIFNLIYSQDHGLLNYLLSARVPRWILSQFGVTNPELAWLRDSRLVMPAIIMAGVWRSSGYTMVYFLAGLQAVREELYEAAAIDGANAWERFVHVTLPGLRPILLFVCVIGMIGAFQLFDIPYVLLGGPGPNDSGLTVVMYLYRTGFASLRLGYAAAIGWVLFAFVFCLSAVQVLFLRKQD